MKSNQTKAADNNVMDVSTQHWTPLWVRCQCWVLDIGQHDETDELLPICQLLRGVIHVLLFTHFLPLNTFPSVSLRFIWQNILLSWFQGIRFFAAPFEGTRRPRDFHCVMQLDVSSCTNLTEFVQFLASKESRGSFFWKFTKSVSVNRFLRLHKIYYKTINKLLIWMTVKMLIFLSLIDGHQFTNCSPGNA